MTELRLSPIVFVASCVAVIAVGSACGDDGGGGVSPDGAAEVVDDVAGDVAEDAPGDGIDGEADAGPLPDPVFEDLPVDGGLAVPGLEDRVSVVRDEDGIPHIYATTFHDVFFTQGYIHALDRMPAMELFRRSANGQLAELLGDSAPSTIRGDIRVRALGFRRVAERQYEALGEDSDARRALDAYAAGVTAFVAELRAGERAIPAPYHLFLPAEILADWSPVDSLAIGRLQAHDLSFDAGPEIHYTRQIQAIRSTFPADDADPGRALRAGLATDLQRWAPVDETVQYEDYPPETQQVRSRGWGPGTPASDARRPEVPAHLLERAAGFFERSSRILGGEQRRGASNSWAAGPSITSTGNAIFCNDPHLALDNPPLFHFSHLRLLAGSSDGEIDAMGANFAGVPGFLVGHTQRVAWGLTTSSDDRTDVYMETFEAGDGEAPPTTVVDGEPQPVEILTDTVRVGNLGEITREVDVEILVTAQGRVLVPEMGEDGTVPLESGEQLSWAWTGFETTPEIEAVIGALFAEDAEELMENFFAFHAANQNVVGADVEGNIFGVSPGVVPIREAGAMTWDPETNPEGTAPWWILPGDGDADWEGFTPDDAGPRVLNPEKGFVVTANEDHFGQTLDNHPLNDEVYLGYEYSEGFRAGRITRLVDGTGPKSPAEGGGALSPADMRRIQEDTFSPLGERLRPLLLPELVKMQEELDTPGTHPELSDLATERAGDAESFAVGLALVTDWDGETPPAVAERGAEPTAAEIESSAATTLFNLWVTVLLDRTFGDELDEMGVSFGTWMQIRALFHFLEGDPADVATYDAEAGDSVVWDRLDTADRTETRAEIVSQSFFEALDASDVLYPEETPLAERVWGELHRLLFDSLLPIPGGALALPSSQDPLHAKGGYARPGDQWTVNVCHAGLSGFDYSCGSGPIVRMCADMDPDGPVVSMMLPGGQVMDPQSPHYADWLPDWLDHEPRFWSFQADQVRDRAGEHLVLSP